MFLPNVIHKHSHIVRETGTKGVKTISVSYRSNDHIYIELEAHYFIANFAHHYLVLSYCFLLSCSWLLFELRFTSLLSAMQTLSVSFHNAACVLIHLCSCLQWQNCSPACSAACVFLWCTFYPEKAYK